MKACLQSLIGGIFSATFEAAALGAAFVKNAITSSSVFPTPLATQHENHQPSSLASISKVPVSSNVVQSFAGIE